MISEGIYALLKNDTYLQSFVGSPAVRGDGTTGVFASLAPAEVTLPFVVVTQMGADQLRMYRGVNRLQYAKFRFGCYGSSHKAAKQVAYAVKSPMVGLYKTLGDPDNSLVEGAWLTLEIDNIEAVPRGTIYSTHVDIELMYLDQTGVSPAAII